MNRPTNEELKEEILKRYQHSPQSQAMRKSSLKYFLGKEHFNYQGHIFDIATYELNDYITWLKNLEGLSIITKKGKWNILASFLNKLMENYSSYCLDCGSRKIKKNICILCNSDNIDSFLIKIPGADWIGAKGNGKKEKEIIDKPEIELILNYIKPRNLKYYLIFRVLTETGMRKGELINIQYDAVNIGKRHIKTIGKRGEKVYYFSRELARFLEIYLNTRKTIAIEGKTLFLTNRFYKYSTRAFNIYLKKVCKKIGIEKNITCHSFRRSVNQHRYDMGCSNEDRKILLNHSVQDVNIESYLTIDYPRFIRLFDQFNPYQDLNL